MILYHIPRATHQQQLYFATPGLISWTETEVGKVTHPVDHKSTAFPCPFLFNTSGATYPKLPASDMSCSSDEWRCFALSTIT